jgi:integrase
VGVVDLVFSKPGLLAGAPPEGMLPADVQGRWLRVADQARELLGLRGIFDPIPFVIRDDGSYDADLSRVLRGMCSAEGMDRAGAMETYSYRVFTFLRWTEQTGRGWRTLTGEQFLEYSRMRQAATDQGGAGLARSSWNTELSAISAFYNAAVELGIVAKSPIKMRAARTTNRFGDLAKPGALVPAARKPQTKRKIKWLRLDQYTKFRDEGLRKLRFPERNAAFADFMLVTGARRAEGSALRLSDVPELRDPKFEGKRTVKWSVPDEDAKGGEGRDSWISKLALRRMIAYRDVERDVQMALAIEAGRYARDLHRLQAVHLVGGPQAGR